MSAAGAQQVALPTQGSLYFPRGLGDPTLTYLAPSAGIPESDARTGSVQLIAKRAAGLCRLPNDLVRYSGGTAEAFIRNALMSRARLTEDRAYLTGTGGSVEPLGLLNYDRSADKTPTQDKVTTYIAGAPTGTGDALLPEDILRILALIEESPDPDGANAWIMRPGLFAQLANARADAVSSGDGAGPFLYPITRGSLGAAVGRQMSGLPVIVSTQMPATRQKGGATNLSCIVVGNFSRAVIGRAGAMELATSPDYAFNSDELMIRIVVRSDFALLVPSSFAVIDTLVLS
jgi:HK97 family phage major capsid protein